MAKRVMIVDDAQFMRMVIKDIVVKMGLEVVGEAGNGEEAIKAYDLYRPELVTMDITMPNMDGISCIEVLMNKNPQLRILVISALADKLTGILALEKGARGFLAKPFNDRQLNDALCELVRD